MTRQNSDWLSAFMAYTKHAEAPPRLYFWVGVTTIAAALRRRVWIDQAYFKWYPNLYTLLVAPPGVVAKSTTADLGMDLLRQVPGINFGPDVVTWQALFDSFRDVHEILPHGAELLDMSCLVISSSEFGNFLRPDDREMVDQLVNLWDGKAVKKRTRMDGETVVNNPCLTIIGCTTPSWISGNFPEYLIGGGLTSRMLFIYADTKAKYVAYPVRNVPEDHARIRSSLIHDLTDIASMQGPFTLTDEAYKWGAAWYEHFHKVESKNIDETILGGYINRKQTMAHKVAMCLVASRGGPMVIDAADLQRAVALLDELEKDMPKVYSRIGLNKDSDAALRMLSFLKRQPNFRCPVHTLYRAFHKEFPDPDKFGQVVEGLKNSGQILILPNLPMGNGILGTFVGLPVLSE